MGSGEGSTGGLSNHSREEASIGVSSLGYGGRGLSKSEDVHPLPLASDLRRRHQNPRQRTDVRCFAGEAPVTDFSGVMNGSFGQVAKRSPGKWAGMQLARNLRRLTDETSRTSNAVAGNSAAAADR